MILQYGAVKTTHGQEVVTKNYTLGKWFIRLFNQTKNKDNLSLFARWNVVGVCLEAKYHSEYMSL